MTNRHYIENLHTLFTLLIIAQIYKKIIIRRIGDKFKTQLFGELFYYGTVWVLINKPLVEYGWKICSNIPTQQTMMKYHMSCFIPRQC